MNNPNAPGRLVLVVDVHELVGFKAGGRWTFTSTLPGVEHYNGAADVSGAVSLFTAGVLAAADAEGDGDQLRADLDRLAATVARLTPPAEGGAS